MAESENNHEASLAKFDSMLSSILLEQLKETEKEIRHVGENGSVEDTMKLLKEANSLIRIICSDADYLYEKFHYRLFLTIDGKMKIIQGTPLDTDPNNETGIGEE